MEATVEAQRDRTHPADHSQSAGSDETRQIERVAFYAFGINLGLALVKGVLALYSGSLAVVAGAIDSGTDSVASLAVFFGLKLSSRKTKNFPMGLYKIENLISVIVAIFIFFSGYEILRQTMSPNLGIPEISLSVLVLLAACTLVTFLFGRYALNLGRKTESPTLIAEGRHRQSDVLSSLIVLASAILSYFGFHAELFGITIDQIAAAVVVIFIARAGWELLSEGMRVLLDASLDHQTLDQVREIILSQPGVRQVKSLVGRNAGRFRFIQTDVELRVTDLQKAHHISQDIEQHIQTKIPHVERVIIHYEPQHDGPCNLALPLKDVNGQLSDHFGEAPYFALVEVNLDSGRIENEHILENPYLHVPQGKGLKVSEWLVDHKVDEVMLKEDLKGKGPGYVFQNAGVNVSTTRSTTLAQAVDELVARHPACP